MTVQQFIDELLKVARPEDEIVSGGGEPPEIQLDHVGGCNGTGIRVLVL